MQKTSTGIYSLIFFTFFYILILSTSGFLLKIPINKFYLPLSVGLSIFTSFKLLKGIDSIQFIKSIVYFIVISVSSYFLSIHFYDFSWDGMAYHQDTIVKLANGWNPTKENSTSIFSIWIDVYQKGVEYIQASIYVLTAKIESGKLYNFMLLIATFLILFDTLKSYINSVFNRLAISFITIFCPVVIAQIFTYYIDSIYYLLTVSIICNLFLLFKYNSRFLYFLFVVTAVLLCNIKFSTIPTFVIFCCFIALYLFWKKKKEFFRPIFISFSSIFLLCVVTNFNPFVMNLVDGKHIFHPLMGEEKIEIMKGNMPSYMSEKGRLTKFYCALFSVANNKFQPNAPEYYVYESKVPFSIIEKELDQLREPDLRLSGFGIYFSGIFILTLLILISVPLFYFLDEQKRLQPQKNTLSIFYFAIAVLSISILINPEMWWARYVPQLWLISVLSLLIIWKSPFLYFKVLKFFLFFSMFFNIIIHSFQVFTFQNENNKKVNADLQKWKEEGVKLKIDETYFVNMHLRLKENDIPFSVEKITKEPFFFMQGTFGQVKLQEVSNLKQLDSISLKDIGINPESNFAEFLKLNSHETIILSAKDEASSGLSVEEKEDIKQSVGLNLKDLGYKDSYIAVISGGKVIFEEMKKDGAGILEVKNNPKLKKLGITKIVSSGLNSGNFSSIKMNGTELSLNKRGINIVLIKNNQTYLLNIDSFQTNQLDPIAFQVSFIDN